MSGILVPLKYITYRSNKMTTNNIPAVGYADAPVSAFPASDVSAQGNAGLNQEGSSESLPLSGPDFSDSLIGNK